MAKGRPPKLSTWIQRQANAGCNRIVLHLGSGNKPKIEPFKIEEGTDVGELAELVLQVATDKAEQIGGRVDFAIRSYAGTEVINSEHTFAVTSEDGEDDAPPVTDTSVSGVVKLLMTHNMAIMKTNAELTALLMAQAREQHAVMGDVMERLSKGFSSGLEARAALAERNSDAQAMAEIETTRLELEVAREERKARMLADGMKVLEQAAPLLLAKLSEGEKS